MLASSVWEGHGADQMPNAPGEVAGSLLTPRCEGRSLNVGDSPSSKGRGVSCSQNGSRRARATRRRAAQEDYDGGE